MSIERERKIVQECIKRKHNKIWADTLQPTINGRPNPDFVKVYGEKTFQEVTKSNQTLLR